MSGATFDAMFGGTAGAEHREFGRIYPPRHDWLARQAPEPVLEPELPIVDAHYHLLDVPGYRYLADELRADIATGHRIEALVYAEVQTGYRQDGPESLRPVGETEFVLRHTAAEPRLAAGIVGYADLTLGSRVQEVLAAHIDAGGGRFKGIRYSTALDPHPDIRVHHRSAPGVMREPAFHDGIRAVQKMGLSFDAFVFFHQLPEVEALARAHPGLNLVLQHCGGLLGYGPWAGRRDEVFALWRSNVSAVAKCPNVSIKLGGMLGRLAAYDYVNADRPEPSERLAEALRPYILHCIDAFGPARCMFESNYPVDNLVTGYAALWNTYKRITADLSPHEKRDAYGGTARRVYRLD
jgi:predicted TIM-barrel fold metal-dependent hydrolase